MISLWTNPLGFFAVEIGRVKYTKFWGGINHNELYTS